MCVFVLICVLYHSSGSICLGFSQSVQVFLSAAMGNGCVYNSHLHDNHWEWKGRIVVQFPVDHAFRTPWRAHHNTRGFAGNFIPLTPDYILLPTNKFAARPPQQSTTSSASTEWDPHPCANESDSSVDSESWRFVRHTSSPSSAPSKRTRRDQIFSCIRTKY